MRLMSFGATTEQIRRQEKSETRRLGWADLKPGEVFCAIEKGQGLKKGETVNRLMILVCRSNRPEPLKLSFTAIVKRLRHEAAEKDPDYGMRLPAGKVCGDCLHWPRCSALIQRLDSKNPLCDFSPHHFSEKRAR